MVKLFKTSIVISMGTWLIFLLGCEKPLEPKEMKTKPVIISGTILPQSPVKVEKKSDLQPGTMAKTAIKPEVPKTSKPAAVTEKQAKREQLAVVNPGDLNADKKRTVYDPTGMVDPFIPLLREKEVIIPKAEDKPKRILTPLEKFSLSQVRLVAVILMENREIAMVQDATGKGYEIVIGTYMGKNSGKVSKINQSSIVIKEYVKDYKGQRQAHFQEIKLQKNESGE